MSTWHSEEITRTDEPAEQYPVTLQVYTAFLLLQAHGFACTVLKFHSHQPFSSRGGHHFQKKKKRSSGCICPSGIGGV